MIFNVDNNGQKKTQDKLGNFSKSHACDCEFVYCLAEVDIDQIETRGVVGPGLVGVGVDPPVPVLQAAFLRVPRLVEPEVDKVGTLLCLSDTGGRRVEAGPGVEDERTVLGVIRVLYCSVYTI